MVYAQIIIDEYEFYTLFIFFELKFEKRIWAFFIQSNLFDIQIMDITIYMVHK